MPDKPRTPIDQLQPGAVLEKPVFHKGRTLFAAGRTLLNEDIQELKHLHITTVVLRDSGTPAGDKTQNDPLSLDLRKQATSILRNAYQDFQNLNSQQTSEILFLGRRLHDEVSHATKLGIAVHDLRDYSNYTYQHCVNVTAISLAIGVRLGLSKEELNNLSVGGLLHDIGKMMVSEKILNKEGPLTDEEMSVVRQHPNWGSELLQEQMDFAPVVWAIARQHHEYMDGSGYPDKLSGSDIHILARIITVVDIWDALRSKRPHKAAWNPDQALDFINGLTMVGKFDPEVLEIFNALIVPYPVGSKVMITGGKVGVVAALNFAEFSRPIIRFESDGKESYLDLLERKSVKVIKTLELAT
jgi:putative nucleotidyltransferase with HDIG domain